MDLIPDSPILEDDSKETESKLIEHRLPWLAFGLLGGAIAAIISSRFEHLLASHINLVFFIPVIVYMADAVGTQTETIYIRNAAKKKIKFSIYLVKETLAGLFMGVIFGSCLGLFALWWFSSISVASTVGLAMFLTIATAPPTALLVSKFLQQEKTDPALGAGPFTTILQDLMSLGIYFLIASIILFV